PAARVRRDKGAPRATECVQHDLASERADDLISADANEAHQ
ncbi:MAG: hypothetical protein FD152_3231, partial [Xanthobacteraceae bacterium]